MLFPPLYVAGPPRQKQGLSYLCSTGLAYQGLRCILILGRFHESFIRKCSWSDNLGRDIEDSPDLVVARRGGYGGGHVGGVGERLLQLLLLLTVLGATVLKPHLGNGD